MNKKLTDFNWNFLKKQPGSPWKSALSKKFCRMGFEPVNLVTGAVEYAGTDFEFPGPLPLAWERCWDSDSRLQGLLGHGTRLCYDTCLERFTDWGAIAVTLPDGRPAPFIDLLPGEEDFNRQEKLTLRHKGKHYEMFDWESHLTYHYMQADCNRPARYLLDKITNEAGHTIQMHYRHGVLCGVTDSAGRKLEVITDGEKRITAVNFIHGSERNRLVSYSYNEAGDLSAITDALGQTTRITYEEHRMVSKTDRNGNSFYWEYRKINGVYRCVHTWGDNGLFEGYIEYHKGYNLVTNTKGGVTRYEFTPEGYVTSETDPLGHTTRTQYTPDMDIWRVIDPQGSITGYAYDEHGLVTEITYPDGNTQRYGYDDRGHITLSLSPEGRSATYVYENNLLKFANPPDNTVVNYKYDEQNMLTRILAPGREFAFSYDDTYNLREVTLNGLTQGRWWYDGYGRPIMSENAEGKIQRWEYDPLGRLIRESLPDGNTVELRYDAYDNVLEAKDKQREVFFTYTPMGSLKTREEDGKIITFYYNKDEELTGVLNEAKERYTFGRDPAGQIAMETGFDGITRRYLRNPAGLVSEVIRPGKKADRYLYNPMGQIARIERFDESWESYSYDKDGLLKEAKNPNRAG